MIKINITGGTQRINDTLANIIEDVLKRNQFADCDIDITTTRKEAEVVGKEGTPFGGYAVVNGKLKEIKSDNYHVLSASEVDRILKVTEPFYVPLKKADKIKNFTPDNWPPEAPPYASAEGWEYEKAAKLKQIRALAIISWYCRQGTARHSLIANRLREIL